MTAGDDQGEHEAQRPRTRGDCVDAPRPCPWISCRHHLAINVTDSGSLQLVNAQLDLEALPDTCSLDVADRGELTLEEVGRRLDLTRERIRQLERSGLRAMKAFAHLAGVRADSLPFVADRDTQPEI